MPEEYREFGRSLVRHHLGWEHILWTEAELAGLEMRNRALYDAAEYEAPTDTLRWRVDIARLEILHRYGGIYVDCDTECLRPLDPLLGHRMFLPESPNDRRYVANAVMGAEPGHPFLGVLLRNLAHNAKVHRGERLVDTVGGKYITRMVERLHPDGVDVLPWWLFAAQSIRDRDRGKPATTHPEAYVRHVYGNTRGSRK